MNSKESMMLAQLESSDVLSVDSHRVVPAPFLTKTYQLVDDPGSNEIVSWGEDGSTFVVWRPPEFARDLLPNYFKHNNFSSFVRQLNTYGFRKVVPDRWEFANDFFRKGERHLLCEIHRRKAQQSLGHLPHYTTGSPSPSSSGEDHHHLQHQHHQQQQQQQQFQQWASLASSGSPLHSPRSCVTAAPSSLTDENERLRRDNCLLLSELARLQRMYDDALMFLQQNMRMDEFRLMQQGHVHQIQHVQQQQQQHEQKKVAVDVHTSAAPKASTIDFVDGKLRELKAAAANMNSDVAEEETDAEQGVAAGQSGKTRLFGVVLHCRKRVHTSQDEINVVNKAAKIELELMPSTTAAAAAPRAPWLHRFRDERVCI